MLLAFARHQRLVGKTAVDIAIPTDPHPFVPFWSEIVRIEHLPQRFAAKLAFVVFTVLVPKKACVGIYSVGRRAVENAHLLHAAAHRAGKAFFQPVPADGGLQHISVAGGFFG